MTKLGDVAILNPFQIIYSSRPFGFDDAILSGILLDARRCNARDGISGALICRHDIYLQFLEGPEAAVQATYERIRRDNRHLEVKTRATRYGTERMFGDWGMLHDPAKSWIWSPADIADGAMDRVGQDSLWDVFESLAANAKSDAEP